MAIFSVLYPATEGGQFDQAYYDATHIPLVQEAFAATGLVGVQVFKGLAAGDGGPPPFVAMAHLTFESLEALQSSLGGPKAPAVLADVAKFTNIQPIAQISTAA